MRLKVKAETRVYVHRLMGENTWKGCLSSANTEMTLTKRFNSANVFLSFQSHTDTVVVQLTKMARYEMSEEAITAHSSRMALPRPIAF